MHNSLYRKQSFYDRIRCEASVSEIVFWWIVRGLIIFCGIKNSEDVFFYLISFMLTFAADILHIILPKVNISARLQSFVSVLCLFSTVIGFGFSVIEKYPEYDIFLQFIGGVFGGALGYYIALALKKPTTKNEFTFVSFFTLSFGGTMVYFRKLTEFFIDFYKGTNICHTDFVEDSHWLYRVLGMGMSPYEQRPLLDMDEDFIFSLMGVIVSTVTVFLKSFIKNRNLFRSEKTKESFIKRYLKDFRNKISLEISKVNKDTSIFDVLFWWGVRFSMIYAFIVMENRAEATLLSANLIATFAITLVHLVFPSWSVLSKINYRVQTLITVIVFLGSYCGNYCFVYNILPRFDLFLHFVSGTLCVLGGYYIVLILFRPTTKKDSILTALFSFCFSCFIMPAWEVSEFIGDFIWGTSNQGFYWGPTDDSFFFKVFGHGVGNTRLYYLFDTVYDVLLATVTTVITFVLLYVFLEIRRVRSKGKAVNEAKESAEEKELVAC